MKATTATTTKSTKPAVKTGTIILALAAIHNRMWGKKPNGKAIACIKTCEADGVILPVAEQAETGHVLAKSSYRSFVAKAAHENDENGPFTKIVKLAKEIAERAVAIKDHKATLAAEAPAEAEAAVAG
jgi:hypothetical protein